MGRSALFAVAAATAIFLPIGLYLQWWLPQDGPGEMLVFAASLPLLLTALAFMRWRTAPTGSAVFLLTLFLWIQVAAFVPAISRRLGPWKEIRTMLLLAARTVEEKRAELGIQPGKPLSFEELKTIERLIIYPRPDYKFPLLGKTVRVRILTTVEPYIGLSYGQGRNAIFDLETMSCTYVD